MTDTSTVDTHIGRLLSCLDKNPLSKTYGSFQRDFWHYRMAADFPSAVYQTGVFSLLLAYRDDKSFFYQDEKILKYIKAGIAYWQTLQNKDGSFSEWYPFERSIVATAFTLYFITETYLELKGLVVGDEKAFKKTVMSAVSFLGKNIDSLVINHTAGAVAALYNAYLVTGDDFCLKALDENKNVLLKNQNNEGWFAEYGQPDAGYQSLSIFFLASYYDKSGDKETGTCLEKALNFLSAFVHPDKSLGGTYMSRNTDYLFCYGLVLASKYFPAADYILANTDSAEMANESTADDRYFIFFFLPDFLLSQKYKSQSVPYQRRNHFFSKSALLVKFCKDFAFFINLSKGGALKVFKKNELVFASCGYVYKQNGDLFTTHAYGYSSFSEVDKNTNQILLRADFSKVANTHYSAFFLLAFRVFNLLFCRFSFIDIALGKFLKKTKILKAKKGEGFVERRISITDSGVVVKDNIYGIPEDALCYHTARMFLKFVPSSAYFSLKNASLPTDFSAVENTDNDGSFLFEKNID